MELTEVRIDIPPRQYSENDKRNALLACYSLVFDEELVIHSIKLIQGDKSPFLCMPSEKKHDHCPECKCKNHITAKYCNSCGNKLSDNRLEGLPVNRNGQVKIYHDLVHPLTSDLRNYLLDECLDCYKREKAHPGTILPMLGEHRHQKRTA